MIRFVKWFFGILFLLGIAAGSFFWATAMITSNFNFRSPLKDSPPPTGKPFGEASTQRVVIVLIDALRYDTSLNTEIMPTLNGLREIGASARMHSLPPSFSEPGYTTILTGAWPEINDGPVFNLDYEDIPTFTQEDLFTLAHRAGWSTAISGYYWFEKLVPQSSVDLSFYTPGEDHSADLEVMAAAIPWLQKNEARFVLIHLDQVDYAGHHEGGAISPAWDAAAGRVDAMLAQIIETLDLSKDTLVVLSDHGQIDAGGHGGQDPVALLEPFIMVGSGVKPGVYGEIQMVDVAPTLSSLMGLSLPATTQGQVLVDMISLPESTLSNLDAATQTQQTELVNRYAAAIGSKSIPANLSDSSRVEDYQEELESLRRHRLIQERVVRAFAVSVLLAAAVALLIPHHQKFGSLSWLMGGLLFVGLFNLRYLVIDQRVYSLSSVISESDLIGYTAITSAIAMLMVWLFVSFYRKVFQDSPSVAGLKTLWLGLTVILVISIPVQISFVLNGLMVTWTLPDYFTSFLALIGLIQALVVGCVTPLLAGLTTLFAKINNKNSE
jgi:hypothetical protein